MSTAIGIDIGYQSHIVSRLVNPVEGATEPEVAVVLNSHRESGNKCKIQYNDSVLAIADNVENINEKNAQCIASFVVEYLNDDVDLAREKPFTGVDLSKKEGHLCMTFKSKDCEKELTAEKAMGLMLSYDIFCALNQPAISPEWLLTIIAQPQTKEILQQMSTLYSVPPCYEMSDISRLRTIVSSFGLPEASYVHRSLPLTIATCFDLWKRAYDDDKMTKKNYLVCDFGYTCSHIYLIGVNRHHMKVKCHLHSEEATGRGLEHALAEAIRKNNGEHKKLWKNESANQIAEELGQKYLPSFFNEKCESVKVCEPSLFTIDGIPVKYVEEITRKNWLKECKRYTVIDSYHSLINRMIDVLKEYKLTIDKIITIGNVAGLDDIKMHLSKSITHFTNDKRLTSSTNKPEAIALGTTQLLGLIRSKQVALDPAFLNVVFWPDASLLDANAAAWATPGILKISHTKSEVSLDVKDKESIVWDTLQGELSSFVAKEMADESCRVALRESRDGLREQYNRVAANLKKIMTAIREKEKDTEENVAGDGKSEAVSKGKSDDLRNAETEEGELEEILQQIESDKYMRAAAENSGMVMQRILDCDQRLQMITVKFPSVILEKKVEPIPETAKPIETKKTKRGGCCKGKSDVVEMGPVA